MDMDLYCANSCMVAELRDELVGMLPPDSDRHDFVSFGCVSRLCLSVEPRAVVKAGTHAILWRATGAFEEGV
jgi:hypothetical protein